MDFTITKQEYDAVKRWLLEGKQPRQIQPSQQRPPRLRLHKNKGK